MREWKGMTVVLGIMAKSEDSQGEQDTRDMLSASVEYQF